MPDIFKPDEGDEIVVAQDAEGGKFRRAEDELADTSDLKEAFASLFEGVELSEEFADKAQLVFSTAVNEAVKAKTAKYESILDAQLKEAAEFHVDTLAEKEAEFDAIVESASALYEEQLEEQIATAIGSITENLDTYLTYVIKEWSNENEIAIESGIKVHMAESLMTGLAGLFESHNIDVSEETVDTVAALEEEVAKYKASANAALTESMKLEEQNLALRAEAAFREVTEGLTLAQTEKLRSLAEDISVDDITSFSRQVKTLKETFITRAAGTSALNEAVDTFVETPVKQVKQLSEHADVAALASMLSRLKK